MRYISTKNSNDFYSDSTAILNNFAEDGGLFVPEAFPHFTASDWERMANSPFSERASVVLQKFIASIPSERLSELTRRVFWQKPGSDNSPNPILRSLNEYSPYPYALELWHGEGGSDVDYVAKLVPSLYQLAHDRNADRVGKKLVLLIPAMAESAYSWTHSLKVSGIEGIVFAANETSNAKRKVGGERKGKRRRRKGKNKNKNNSQSTVNIHNYTKTDFADAIEVKSTYTDLQAQLLKLAQDEEFLAKFDDDVVFQVVTDYSWPMILSRITYMVSLYADFVKQEDFDPQELIDVVIPSSDLSAVLAALYTKACGANFGRILLASNKNHQWTDFVRNGSFNLKRRTYRTNSPALDNLGNENLFRLLFEFAERNSDKLNNWLKDLDKKDRFNIDKTTLNNMQTLLVAGFADDASTRQSIIDVYTEFDHLVDPNTAVGFAVKTRYDKQNKKEEPRKTVYLSLFSPYLYPGTVADAVLNNPQQYRNVDDTRYALYEESELHIPERYGLAKAQKRVETAKLTIKGEEKIFYGQQEYVREEDETEEEDSSLIEAEQELAKKNLEIAQAELELELEQVKTDSKTRYVHLNKIDSTIVELLEQHSSEDR